MGSLWQQYLQPASLAAALQALASAPGPACPIAGGTDLLLEMRQSRRPPAHTLVDISALPELTVLEVRGAELFIGAAVSHSRIIHSPLVQQHARALAEACGLIGGPQVRNVATLGGNVAHALPAADGAIALLALGAGAAVAALAPDERAEARAPSQDSLAVTASAVAEQRAAALTASHTPGVLFTRLPLLDLYLGPGQTALKTGQLLVGFYLPLSGRGEGSAFTRVMRLQGVALPVLNLGVWLRRAQGLLTDIRIAIGPAGPVPRRAAAAEAALRGRPLSGENLAEAEAALLAEAQFRTSPQRATAGYRQHLAGKLLAAAVGAAWERAA